MICSAWTRLFVVGPVIALLYVWFALVMWLHYRSGILWKLSYVLIGVPFVLADVLFNVVIGSFIFWELPREWLFTTRLSRHKNSGVSQPRYEVAWRLCRLLSAYDNNHC